MGVRSIRSGAAPDVSAPLCGTQLTVCRETLDTLALELTGNDLSGNNMSNDFAEARKP